MKSWYSNSNDIEMKDGSKWKEYRVVFETDSKELKLRFGGMCNVGVYRKQRVSGLYRMSEM